MVTEVLPVDDVDYTITHNDEDLQQILDLQTRNRPEHLSDEELKAQGFVTARHTLDALRTMHNEYPHIVAKHRDRVVGYALCMMKSAEEIVPSLSGLFSMIESLSYQETKPLVNIPINDDTNNDDSTEYRYFVMGQVCVDKQYRGTGVFDGLYRHMRCTMAPHFHGIVTAISSSNPRSIRAHAKVGFETIHEFHSKGHDWKLVLWDWTTTINGKSNNGN